MRVKDVDKLREKKGNIEPNGELEKEMIMKNKSELKRNKKEQICTDSNLRTKRRQEKRKWQRGRDGIQGTY